MKMIEFQALHLRQPADRKRDTWDRYEFAAALPVKFHTIQGLSIACEEENSVQYLSLLGVGLFVVLVSGV